MRETSLGEDGIPRKGNPSPPLSNIIKRKAEFRNRPLGWFSIKTLRKPILDFAQKGERFVAGMNPEFLIKRG
jgi:hypothetical protein